MRGSPQEHRVIAFDMPWHGKSSPPAGWHDEEYQLTSAQYTTMILEIIGRARTRQADPDRLLDRRPHRAASGARASRTFPRHHRPAGRRACRSLLRSQFPAPARRAWRRGLRRHRLRAGRPRCAGQGALGDAVALHAGRPRRLQGRSRISTRSTATSAAGSRRSTRDAARCFCCRANTTIPARRRRRWRWPTALPAARSPS